MQFFNKLVEIGFKKHAHIICYMLTSLANLHQKIQKINENS